MDLNEFSQQVQKIDQLLDEKKLDSAKNELLHLKEKMLSICSEFELSELERLERNIDSAWTKRARRSFEEIRVDSHSNNSIWNEYNFLIEKIGEQNDYSYENLRFGIMPLVHLMCHSVELGLKFNIEILRKYFPEYDPETKLKVALKIEKTHDLYELTRIFKAYFKFAFDSIPSIGKFDSVTVKEFNNLIKSLDDFLDHVKPNTSAYRYESLISRYGKRTPAIEKGHSIFIFDLFVEYRTLYTALRYSLDCFEPYFQYKELKEFLIEYNRGVGVLYKTKDQIHVDLETGIKSSDALMYIEKYRSDGSKIYGQSESDKYVDILVPGVLFFNKMSNQYFELLEVGHYHYLNVISRADADEVFIENSRD